MTQPGSVTGADTRAALQPTGPRVGPKIEKAKDPRSTLRRLWSYFSALSKQAHAGRGLRGLYTLLGLCGPYLMGLAIDRYIVQKSAAGLASMALWMLGAYLLSSVFSAVRRLADGGLVPARAQRHACAAIRASATLADRVFRPPTRRRTDEPAHQRHRRHQPSRGAEHHRAARQRTLDAGHPDRDVRARSLAGARIRCWWWPIMFWFTRFVAIYTRRGFRDLQRALGGLNGVMEEAISGQRVVKAFRRSGRRDPELSRTQSGGLPACPCTPTRTRCCSCR